LPLRKSGVPLLSSVTNAADRNSLMVFLRDNIPSGIRKKNRQSTVEFLGALAKRNVLADQETLILAYGQVARYDSFSQTVDVS
jgi:hypothetical protein